MFELNGFYSYVQETKTATANRSRFWLPKFVLRMRQLKKGACQGDVKWRQEQVDNFDKTLTQL